MLLSTDILAGAGPEPKFCNLVSDHEIFKPNGAETLLKLERVSRRSTCSSSWQKQLSVISICEIFEVHRSNCHASVCSHMPHDPINGDTERHRCKNTPVVVWMCCDRQLPTHTGAPVLRWRAATRSTSMCRPPVLANAFHSTTWLTESNAGLTSKYATFSGLSNHLWCTELHQWLTCRL